MCKLIWQCSNCVKLNVDCTDKPWEPWTAFSCYAFERERVERVSTHIHTHSYSKSFFHPTRLFRLWILLFPLLQEIVLQQGRHLSTYVLTLMTASLFLLSFKMFLVHIQLWKPAPLYIKCLDRECQHLADHQQHINWGYEFWSADLE